MSDPFDLRDTEAGDRLRLTTDRGETFEGEVVGYDNGVREGDGGYIEFPFEGREIWEQVNDRVDVGVLHVYQKFKGRDNEPQQIELTGTAIEDNGEKHREKLLGYVEQVEFPRPDGWPEMYSAAGRSAQCPHQMHWDSTEGNYQCIHQCGEVDETPPTGKTVDSER